MMRASSSDFPVHQLWPPPESKLRTKLDVVLFHGLQLTANDTSDAWSSTWTQRGHDDVCWPRDWLPNDLGEALGEAVRIFSVSYNANVVTSPHGHVSEIAHNLVQSLIHSRYEWHRPIVLIGHSFGGLVLKSLVVKLKRKLAVENATDRWSEATVQCAKMFLNHVTGVAFYAVPHAGSRKFAKYVKRLLKCNNGHQPGIMDNIQPWQRDMEQLSVDFEDIVNEKFISIYAFCEGKPIEHVVRICWMKWIFKAILVDFSSAQRLARHNFYKVEDADHMEVCKPLSRKHPSYELLLRFIIDCRTVARVCDQPVQEDHDLPESTFGLETYVESVETLVTSEGNDAAPRYVGVCGMGGVGKTLLLQRLYGSPQLHGHFHGAKFIWCTVGQRPDIMALYRRFSKELALQEEETSNADDYKSKLLFQFKQKRVLLVLDDVWKGKEFDSLDLAKGDGSVTLLSTRNLSLLERASPHISQVHMTSLSKGDSWSLFCVHAFSAPYNVPCELKDLVQSMAEECQGLPLALKVIGRAMFGKTSPEDQWEPLLKKLRESRLQVMTVDEELYERLKIGYNCLSEDDDRLEHCFLYFAAFPEDFRIGFNTILWHWTGEGLVPGNVRDEPRGDVLSLLNKLRERSFIELDNRVVLDEYTEDILAYKIHDVMRDLAFFIVNNQPHAKQRYLSQAGQNLEVFPQEWKATSTQPFNARRLSLHRNNLNGLPESFCAPELLSLLLGENPIISLPASFLRSFSQLKILDLSEGKFQNLPEELGDLQNLVWLDLSNCFNLEILPNAVGQLHALKYLNLNFCENLANLPSGVVGLTSLQQLGANCDKLIWADDIPSHTASLEDICRLGLLTDLRIFGVSGLELTHNISALKKLKILYLGLTNLTFLPDEMGYWYVQLQELHLWCLYDLVYLPDNFTREGAFPALIQLELFQCSKFVCFPEVKIGALPKLQRLEFNGCDSLKILPLSLDVLTSLTKLSLFECNDSLRDSCTENCDESEQWRKFNIRYEM